MPADEPQRTWTDDDEPDPSLLWRWVGGAVRPYIGWILIGLAALLMLLGWFGVSREAVPGKQIPYLVSGGIGGIFLAVLGAYFLGTQALRDDSGRLDRLEHMVEELHGVLLRRPDAPDIDLAAADKAASANGSSSPSVRRVLIVAGGETFHRADCALVAGKDSEQLSPAGARKRGLRPCPACAPVSASSAN
jgi:hypothetical protein